MPTRASIQQSVITRLGSEAPQSLADDTDELVAIARIYPNVVETMLTKHAWTFARKTATLTVSAETPELPWLYSFPLPTDCLSVREVRRGYNTADYDKIGTNIVAMSADDLTLEYTAAVSEERWPADFADAIEEETLGRMCEAFEMTERGAQFRQNAGRLLRMANARDARQRPTRRGTNTRALRAWYNRMAGRV